MIITKPALATVWNPRFYTILEDTQTWALFDIFEQPIHVVRQVNYGVEGHARQKHFDQSQLDLHERGLFPNVVDQSV